MTRTTVSPADIQRVFLFSGIDGDMLINISKTAARIECASGQPLFHLGDPATYFYFVESGRILLSRSSSAGDEKVIALIGPDETFAEAMMFDENRRGYPVDARAIEHSSLLRFSVATMRDILAQSPECCFRVMGVLSTRLHELVLQIDEITLHNGTYRLVAYLLRQLPPDAEHARDIQLAIPKNVIASHLSLQPETFSRILANLRHADLIVTEGAHIVLKDVAGLRQLLET